jgi:futalosine hydrolase
VTKKRREIVLISATLLEMRAALKLLPGGPDLALSPDVPFTFPSLPALSLPGGMLRLLVCGVGPAASGFALGMALGQVCAEGRMPAGVVNPGIAGSYDCDRAPVGGIVLANGECLPEYGVWPEADEETPERDSAARRAGAPAPLDFPQATPPSGPVFDRLALTPDSALNSMGLAHPVWFRQGPGVTVAGVSGTARRAGRMAELTGGLMENMEGFSLALGCMRLQLPFAELRAISNRAGQRPPLGWNIPEALAALGQATFALFAPWL